MKKFFILVLIIIGSFLLGINYDKIFEHNARTARIRSQIEEIEIQLSQIKSIHESCQQVALYNPDRQFLLECLKGMDFSDWVRNFTSEPELEEVKRAMLTLANRMYDLTVKIAIENDYDVEFRSAAEIKIPEALTNVREKILIVEKSL